MPWADGPSGRSRHVGFESGLEAHIRVRRPIGHIEVRLEMPNLLEEVLRREAQTRHAVQPLRLRELIFVCKRER